MMPAFECLLASPEALAVFDAPAVVQALLDAEAVRLRARAAEGQVPLPAAQVIAGVCKAALFDLPALERAGRSSGGLAEPLLAQLAATVGLFDPAAAAHVPRGDPAGALAQTAMALLERRALALIDRDLAQAAAAMLAHGLDAGPLLRCQRRLHELAPGALRLVMAPEAGGPAEAIGARMAHALQLAEPATAAQDESMRLHAELGLLAALLSCWIAERRPAAAPAAGLRAPQRVATLLCLLAQPAGGANDVLRFAETANLYLETHAQLAAWLYSLRAQASPAARVGADMPEPQRAALLALAQRQAAEAPWARFLPDPP